MQFRMTHFELRTEPIMLKHVCTKGKYDTFSKKAFRFSPTDIDKQIYGMVELEN